MFVFFNEKGRNFYSREVFLFISFWRKVSWSCFRVREATERPRMIAHWSEIDLKTSSSARCMRNHAIKCRYLVEIYLVVVEKFHLCAIQHTTRVEGQVRGCRYILGVCVRMKCDGKLLRLHRFIWWVVALHSFARSIWDAVMEDPPQLLPPMHHRSYTFSMQTDHSSFWMLSWTANHFVFHSIPI